MARRIVITDPLTDLNTPWSGTNDHGQQYGYDKEQIEALIKAQFNGKFGAFRWEKPEGENYYYLLMFTKEDDATAWEQDPAVEPLSRIKLPILTETGTTYSARLATSIEDTTVPIVLTRAQFAIPLRFSAVQTIQGESMDAGINGTIHILQSTDGIRFDEVGTAVLPSRRLDEEVYNDVEIGKYLKSGTQQMQFYATFEYQDDEGVTKIATSTRITLSSVTYTLLQLSLAPESNWQTPFSGNTISLFFYIQGYGNKVLYVTIDNVTVANGIVAPTSTETPFRLDIDATSDGPLARLFDNDSLNGLHTVTSWIAYASDSTVRSEYVETQILYFKEDEATPLQKQTTYVMVNGVASTIQPYVYTRLLDFAIYKYGETSIDTSIYLYNSNRTILYFSHELGSMATGEVHSYSNAIQLPNRNIQTVNLYFGFDGVLQDTRSWELNIDQSVNFLPKPLQIGDFFLDPSTRSNEEEHPERIVNAVDGSVVASEWSNGMTFKSPIGYVEDDGEPKHLYIPAGQWLRITGYDPLSGNGQSVTVELDVKISDIYDEDTPVLQIGTSNLGFSMLPLTAWMKTVGNQNRYTQNIQLEEDRRTHITLNIVRNLSNLGLNYCRIFVDGCINREFTYSDEDTFIPQGGSGGFAIGSEYAGISIYSIKVLKQGVSANDIVQDRLSAIPDAASKVDFQRKNDIIDENTGLISYDKTKEMYSTMLWIPDELTYDTTNGQQTYLPCYANKGASYPTGTLKVIFRYRYATGNHAVGDINFELTRILTHMSVKGQGTSSMTYWAWNLRFQFTDQSEVWSVDDSLRPKDLLLSNADPEKEDCFMRFEEGGAKATKLDAKLNWASSSQSHKMGMMNAYGALWKSIIGSRSPFYASDNKTRPCILQEAFMFFVQDAAGDTSRADFGENASYIRFNNFFTFGPAKNDKATWGHKVVSPHYVSGGTQKSMFTCLEGSSNGRPLTEAKVPWIPEEVFYYFNTANKDDDANETLIYGGQPQFDFDKGPSNEQTYGNNKTYDVPKGFTSVGNYMWQETQDMEFDANDPYKTNGNTIKFYRRAWNLAYLNSHRLEAVEGDYNTFIQMPEKDNGKQYFVMNNGGGHIKGDCFRYNPLSENDESLPKWVNAGITKDDSPGGDGYVVLNLLDDLAEWMPSGFNSYNNAAALQSAFITARLNRYRGNYNEDMSLITSGSGLYWDEKDCDLCQAWGKVKAAKDNWCKNTYIVLNPDGKLVMFRDDDDTILDNDNVGRDGAPYQIEEHDRYNDNNEWCDENGKGAIYNAATGQYNTVTNATHTYFNSEDSVLFCLREQTRGAKRSDMGTELRDMVGTIYNTMSSLEGSVEAFEQKYFFDIQEYFPAVAYNEVGRLLYEDAKLHMSADYSGQQRYTNGTDPMTQNLGNHLSGERQWVKRRTPYMMSYGRSNGFISNTGSLNFRSQVIGGETNHSYTFVVTPHQFLYPAAGRDAGTPSFIPSNASHQRPRPGEPVTLSPVIVGQDTNVFIYGLDYLRSVGDFAAHPTSTSETFTVNGTRLREWIVNGDGLQTVNFSSPTVDVSAARRLQRVVMRDVTSLTGLGGNSLSTLTKAEEIDLRGCTGITSLRFPETATLKTVKLPSTMTAVNLTGQSMLSTLTIDGYTSLASLTVKGCPLLRQTTRLHVLKMKRYAEVDVTRIDIDNIDWQDGNTVDSDTMRWLLDVGDAGVCKLSGRILMASTSATPDGRLYYEDVARLIRRYGNIYDQNIAITDSGLFVDFAKTSITAEMLAIKGRKYIIPSELDDPTIVGGSVTGGYFNELDLIVNGTGNNVAAVQKSDGTWTPNVVWTIETSGQSSYVEIQDQYSPSLHIIQVDSHTVVIKATVIDVNGNTRYVEKKIGLWRRIPQVGDFAWTDGEFDNENDASKFLAGLVVMRQMYTSEDALTTDVTECAYYKLWIYSYCGGTSASSGSVTMRTSTDGTSANYSGVSTQNWGMYPVTGGSSVGLDDTKQDGVYVDGLLAKIATDTGRSDIFDTPLTNRSGDVYLRKDAAAVAAAGGGVAMQDETKSDGWATQSASYMTNFNSEGEKNTLLAYADTVLAAVLEYCHLDSDEYLNSPDYFDDQGHVHPQTPQALADLTQMLVKYADNQGVANPTRYREFMFPAARLADTWCPVDVGTSSEEKASIAATLDNEYKRGKWMLPSSALLARIFNFVGNSRAAYNTSSAPIIEKADNDPSLLEAQLPVFANAIARGRTVPVSYSSGQWSSTEGYRNNARNVYFDNGLAGYNNKNYGYVVRPVAAFKFVP